MFIFHYKYENEKCIILKSIKLNDCVDCIRDSQGNYLDKSEHDKLDMNDPKLNNYRIIYNCPFMMLVNPLIPDTTIKFFEFNGKEVEIKLDEIYNTDS